MVPNNYLVIDTETTGFDKPFICQFGMCMVKEGVITGVDCFNFILPIGVTVDDGAFKTHGLSREKLEKTGSDAKGLLQDIRMMIKETSKSFWLLGQNLQFDANVLNYNFNYHGLPEIEFHELNCLDVGVAFKAHQLGRRRGVAPMAAFLREIREIRAKGVKWNLDFCMRTFGIDHVRGDHDAGEDCRLTHEVYQKMKEKGVIKEVLFA